MHGRLCVKYRIAAIQILGEDLLYECQRSVVRLTDQVQVVILTAARAQTQFRQDLRQCQRVRRRIDLRNDIDAQLTRFLDEISELILRVEEVCARQILLVNEILSVQRHWIAIAVSQRAAFLDAGFQTECRVCAHRIRYRFQRDQVIVDVYLEVVHLVPGHFLNDLFHEIHGERSSGHIHDITADLIQRIVTSDSLRERLEVVQLQSLQDRTSCPIRTGLCLSSNRDGVFDIHQIAFFHQAHRCIIGQSKIEISCLHIITGSLHDGNVFASEILVVRSHFLSRSLQSLIRIDDAAGIAYSEVSSRAFPLTQFRQDVRSGIVALFLRIRTRDRDADFLELIFTSFVIRDLEGYIDHSIHDRRIDMPIFINDLLIIRTLILNRITVCLRIRNIQRFISQLRISDLDLIGNVTCAFLDLSAIDFHLKQGNGVPSYIAIRVLSSEAVDIQANITCAFCIVQDDAVRRAGRTIIDFLDRSPVRAIIGNLDLIMRCLSGLPVQHDGLDVAGLSQIHSQPMRAISHST